jgi:hypothetical protein
MTAYTRWGIATRLVVLAGFLLGFFADRIDTSGRYIGYLVILGWAITAFGVAAGLGIIFRRYTSRIIREENERRRRDG